MQRIKRLLAILLAAIMMFTSLAVQTVFAQDETAQIETRPLGEYYFEYRTSSGSWRRLGTPVHYDLKTGRVAYCLEHDKDSPENESYSQFNESAVYSNYVQEGLKAIMQFGYPNADGGFSVNEARYATANAIRAFLAESMGAGYEFMDLSRGKIRPMSTQYKKLYDWMVSLVKKARNGETIPTPEFEFKNVSPEWKYDKVKNVYTANATITMKGIEANTYYIRKADLPEGLKIEGHGSNRL